MSPASSRKYSQSSFSLRERAFTHSKSSLTNGPSSSERRAPASIDAASRNVGVITYAYGRMKSGAMLRLSDTSSRSCVKQSLGPFRWEKVKYVPVSVTFMSLTTAQNTSSQQSRESEKKIGKLSPSFCAFSKARWAETQRFFSNSCSDGSSPRSAVMTRSGAMVV